MFETLTSTFRSIGDKTYEFSRSGTVSLAVSGLSKAGKTVFLTSLIANLRVAARGGTGRHRMNGLKCVHTGRLVWVRAGDSIGQPRPLFDVDRFIAAMTMSPPAWPTRTGATAETWLTLRFGPPGVTAGNTSRTADLTVRLIDYPGEWLLDLPLLGQSFATWSTESLDGAKRGVRAELSGPFLRWLDRIDPDAPVNPDLALEGAVLWRDFLHDCRGRGLRFLQPGRLVRDDKTEEDAKPELDGRPARWFFPLPAAPGAFRPVKGSLREFAEAAFDGYRDGAVRGFFEDAFSGPSRHIVLVDVLAALNGGQEVWDDTTRSLRAVYQAFARENASLVNRLRQLRLRGGPEKVLFAATKADHLPEAQRETLSDLLRKMLDQDISRAEQERADCKTMAIASVCCTTEETVMRDGQRLDAVVGRPVSKRGEEGPIKRKRIVPQPLPGGVMAPAWWRERTGEGAKPYDFPVFEPPAMPTAMTSGIPHINLDEALEYLLGDRLK